MTPARKPNVLELRLSWKDGQSHLEALADGVSVSMGDEVNLPNALLPSINRPGYFHILTCECGDAGCAGYMEPEYVSHWGDYIVWTEGVLRLGLIFEQTAYAEEVRRVAAEGRAYLKANPEIPRQSVEHPNMEYFRGRIEEWAQDWSWEQTQKRYTEERLRRYLWENDREEFQRRYRSPSIKKTLGCFLRLVLLVVFLPVLIPLWIGMLVYYRFKFRNKSD